MAEKSEETQLLGINTDAVDHEQIPLVQESEERRPAEAPIIGDGEEEEEEESLEDYADMVITILQPVAITMLLVVWIVRVLNASNIVIVSSSAIYQVYTEEDGDGTATKLFGSLLNALLFLAIIIAVTVLFVILYKYRCLKIIYAWLITSTGMLLAVFGGYLFEMILEAENLAMDYVTFSIILWNFSVVGIMAIFWYAPQKVTQGYLILISALMAVWFTRLPEWTTWSILAVVAIYDLFAVLCPRGPLKVLVETAQERKEPIPALLYNASVVIMMAEPEGRSRKGNFTIMSDDEEEEDEVQPTIHTHTTHPDSTTSTSTTYPNNGGTNNNNNIILTDYHPPARSHPSSAQPQEQEKRGVKLGLGDFVFYSVLMGRAALFDMITVFTCFIAIITGLFMTLLLLAMFRRALPALPISIALGIIFYFLTSAILWPFVVSIGQDQIFI
jgi:presenilin 1